MGGYSRAIQDLAGDRPPSFLGRESFRMSAKSAEVVDESFKTTGAIVTGRRWFDVGERPWGDNPPFHMPVLVVTHRARAEITKGETTFTSVTDGIESALRQAKAAAAGRRLFEDMGPRSTSRPKG